MAGQPRSIGKLQVQWEISEKEGGEIGRHHMLTSVLHTHAHTCIHMCTHTYTADDQGLLCLQADHFP